MWSVPSLLIMPVYLSLYFYVYSKNTTNRGKHALQLLSTYSLWSPTTPRKVAWIAMGKKKLSSAEVERIVHGLFREHLKRRGMTDVLAAFDADCPRTENSLKKSSQIAEALGTGGKKLYKQNKSSKKPLDSLLAVLSSHYYKKGKSEEKSSKSKLTEVAKKTEANHPEVPETNSPTVIDSKPPQQIKNF